MNSEINRQRRLPLPVPFHYGWLVVALTFMATLCTAGVRSAPQVFIKPFEAEFGWSRPAIASAIAINLFLLGAGSPLSGWLLDHFGPRRVMLGALALLSVGIAATTIMQEIWQLILLWGVVIGIGASALTSVLAASVSHRWFVARRGLALGILNSAGSTGQLIFIPLLMAVVVAAGWRVGSLVLVASCVGFMVLIWFLMRDDPSDVGLEPYTQEAGTTSAGVHGSARTVSQTPSATSVLEAMRSPTFWLLSGAYFVCGGTTNGLIGTHLIPHALDRGIPAVTAATMIGVMGAMNFVGTLTAGWLTDRMDARKLLALFFALRALSLFILPYVSGNLGLFIFAVIYGLDWFATVPPVVALTGDTFGKHSVGRIYGWIFLSHQVGGALSAIGGGFIFAWFGVYDLAFLIGGGMGLVAAAMSLSITPHRQTSLFPTAPSRPARA
ncbi:MAG: MFS transporter [Terriglobia bacterium]